MYIVIYNNNDKGTGTHKKYMLSHFKRGKKKKKNWHHKWIYKFMILHSAINQSMGDFCMSF